MIFDKGEFADFFLQAANKNGLASLILPYHIDAFYALTERMLTVNEQFNLTAIKEPRRVILLHYIDSLVGARFFPEGASVIDVGCGAGFPSLPLAIFRPDLKITALDATAKRVRYVRETADLLGLCNLETLTGRAEDIAADKAYRERFDAATARAVAALPVLSELCLPFVRVGGSFIAMKGKSGREELALSKNAISLLGGATESVEDTPIFSPEGEAFDHTTVLIRKTAATDKKYPRPYGKILKSPL